MAACGINVVRTLFVKLTLRCVASNGNRVRQGQNFFRCCWPLLLPLCWQPSILINLQQHLMADCRIVGKIYPGAVRCNCATGTRIFCAGFLYIHISHSSVCIRLQTGSWADTLRCDSGFSNEALCSSSDLSHLALCSSSAEVSVIWAFLGMVLSTENIKDKAQLCETSPGREVAARKLG